jgi:hypothetical protein
MDKFLQLVQEVEYCAYTVLKSQPHEMTKAAAALEAALYKLADFKECREYLDIGLKK